MQVFKNCRLNCRFAFPFFLPLPLSLSSLFLFQRQIRYNVNASVARSITKQISIPLIHGLNRNLFFFFSFFYTRKKAQDGKIGRSVVERYERGAGCGRRAVSVKTQIVSWKEDAATWLILLARVPAPLDLQDLSISGSCLGPASSGNSGKKFKLDPLSSLVRPKFSLFRTSLIPLQRQIANRI